MATTATAAARRWLLGGALALSLVPRAALAGPVLDVKPAMLDFVAAVGDKSAPQAMTVGNTGDADLSIFGFLVSGFYGRSFVFAPALPQQTVLAKGKSLAFMVTFQPTNPGQQTAQLQVFTDSGQQLGANLSGTAGARIATMPPHGDTFGFGRQHVGAPAATQALTVANDVNVAIGIAAVKVYGGTPDAPTPTDAFTIDEMGPFSLAAGRKRDINVSFKPKAEMDYVAYLQVDPTDAARYPSIVKLTGSGVLPALNTTPDALDFGVLPVGKQSTLRYVSLTNGSALSLPLALGTDAPAFVVSPTSLTLAPGKQMEIAVAFTPDMEGEFPARLYYSIKGGGMQVGSTGLYGQGAPAPKMDAGAVVPMARGGGCTLGGTPARPSTAWLAGLLLPLAALLRRRGAAATVRST